MPYIQKKEREVLNPYLNEIIKIILNENTKFKKAEAIGYFTRYLTHSVLFGTKHSNFNSEIAKQADKVLNYILEPLANADEEQLFTLAGNLNYSISYVAWGFLGDHRDAPKSSYGLRCYTAQQIRNVLESFSSSGDSKTTVIKGVLNDVLDELYRRKTAIYEDKKILENGDLEF